MAETCPTCDDSGHDPAAPWLLCPRECARVMEIRHRSIRSRMAPDDAYRGADRIGFYPRVDVPGITLGP